MMFEILSWSYRFVFIFFIALFSLFSCHIYFNRKIHLGSRLPLIITLMTACSFGLIAYYFEPLDIKALYIGASLLGIYWFSRFVVKNLMEAENILLFDCVNFLLSIGMAVLYRLSPDYGFRQIIFVLIGSFTFFLVFFLMKCIKVKSHYWVYMGIILFVSLVLTQMFGIQINGSKNWVKISTLYLQPSEILKIVFIYFVACLLDKNLTPKRFIGISGAVLTVVGFFALQRDLGSAFIFFAIYLIMLAVVDGRFYYTAVSGCAAVGAAFVSYLTFAHIKSRVTAWANPWKYISNKSYQITQSLFAVATGGLLGTGLFLGDPKFIPAIHTDFIFSAICEETGILSAMAILSIYGLITLMSMDIALKCQNKINLLVSLGLASTTAIQTLIIVCGVLNIIPITGVTLPYISYGGSSVLSQFMNLGLLYFIAENERKQREAVSEEEVGDEDEQEFLYQTEID